MILKISPKLRREIYSYAKTKVGGTNPLFECGLRWVKQGERHVLTVNAKFWPEDSDLDSFCRLKDLKEVPLDDANECLLDLYATTTYGVNRDRKGRIWGIDRQLETNVSVLFGPEGVKKVAAVGDSDYF